MKIRLSHLAIAVIMVLTFCCFFALPLSAAEITDADSNLGTGVIFPEEEPEYQPPMQPRARAILPSSVDLSAEKYFPVIGSQGSVNSCGSWSTTYYAFTYMVARMNDWDAKNNSEYVFSPKWTYNYINFGTNAGTTISDNLFNLSMCGAARWSEFNYTEQSSGGSNWLAWSGDPDIAARALENRLTDSSYNSFARLANLTPITGPNSPALTNIKTTLNNKKPLVFGTEWGWRYAISDEHGYVATHNTSTSLAHALCVVGYDDNVTYDLNENGTIEEFERGALKVANSHGTSYRNNGYVWVMYDALNMVSNAENLNPDNRSPIIKSYAFYTFDVANYSPTFTAEITLDTVYRGEVTVTLGQWDTENQQPTTLSGYPTQYKNSGGPYPFAGPLSDTEGTIVVDMDRVTNYAQNWQDKTWYVQVSDSMSNGYTTQVKNVKFLMDGVVISESTPHDQLNTTKKAYLCSPGNIPVRSLALSPASTSLYVGSSTTLTPTFTPSNATDKTLFWTSSNTAVATVNAQGLVTARSAGEAVITATTSNGATAEARVTVVSSTIAVTGVTVTPATASINQGATVQLSATVTPSNATNKTVTWTSSNTSVATVTSAGRVTGISAGTATITATSNNGKTATSRVTVVASTIAVDKVTIAPLAASFNIGGTVQLTATVTPSNAANKTVTWTSSNTAVVTVTSAGRITGVADGTATITATSNNGKTAICRVTVYPSTITPEKVTVTPAIATIDKGATLQLTATVSPGNAWNKTVTWSSSNTSVATVTSAGRVTGLADGTVTITARTVNGKTSTSKVTVVTPTIAVDKVTITPTTGTIHTDSSLQLAATVSPSNASNKSITWTSSNRFTAHVTSDGLVLGRMTGTVTITATSNNGKTATKTITVLPAIYATGISLNHETKSMYVGNTLQLVPTIVPSNTSNKTVTWSSTRPHVATVSETGLVTCHSAGLVAITAQASNGRTVICRITVSADD